MSEPSPIQLSQVRPEAADEITFVGTATTIISVVGFAVLTDPNFLHRGEKLPGDAQIKRSSVITNIFGASGTGTYVSWNWDREIGSEQDEETIILQPVPPDP
jgi:hypothetical protein